MAAMTLEEKVNQLNMDCSQTLDYPSEAWAKTSFGTLGIE